MQSRDRGEMNGEPSLRSEGRRGSKSEKSEPASAGWSLLLFMQGVRFWTESEK